ncbi:ferritin-like domain-containing protein [Mesorhizobium sp. YM1C-6-2]|uniref:YciE/YciF ferroxidase family protein n=1 Tax=Mesorhizobium sp. YM1C-6-2 TaxID=1827501 RepID=UPI000EF1BF02|nr:ferritin-like domain-containing protein [Mesorhizobium sp. YM1C-6-2]RLP24003.1 ferritin-like domain-containing protein [Mesorhizobium sp. YM1C-6-2]
MPTDNGLQTLFLDGLKDIYYAENQILKALPKMAEAVATQEVTDAFEKHLSETEAQVERLKQVFEILGQEPKGKECPAIDGIIAEGEEIIEQHEGTAAIDAGLVAAAQAVEHYEIARYGALVAWAGVLELSDAAEILQVTLEEEEATDEALTELADGGVNQAALGESEVEEEDAEDESEVESEQDDAAR